VACEFTTNRMLSDYIERFYAPQAKRAGEVKADDFKVARDIAAWKKHVRRSWEDVQVISRTEPQASYDISEKSPLHSEIVLNLGELRPEFVGVELVFAQTDIHGKLHIDQVNELQVVEAHEGTARYAVDVMPGTTGVYQVGLRIFAKHPLLPHRQDFECVKWI
jgi:phosphorylase/glycogen(starch) synthase